jgi:hypothetical protein
VCSSKKISNYAYRGRCQGFVALVGQQCTAPAKGRRARYYKRIIDMRLRFRACTFVFFIHTYLERVQVTNKIVHEEIQGYIFIIHLLS